MYVHVCNATVQEMEKEAIQLEDRIELAVREKDKMVQDIIDSE